MRKSLPTFLKDPLWHFLLAGAVVFLVSELMNPDASAYESPKTIVINRDSLLTELQFRTKTFEPELAARRLDSLSSEALDKLISDYVRSEVLYREADALGFSENDYIIKKRMIQKMDFIIQDVSEVATSATEEDVLKHYQENQEDYLIPGYVTFTHVFIDAEDIGADAAMTDAVAMLETLDSSGAGFIDAPRYGDRFPYGLNYVEKPKDLISSHFGADLANEVFTLTPRKGAWQGPIRSEHGAHLVMLITSQPDRMPPLEEVKDRVIVDVERELIESQRLKAIDKLVETYTINNEYQSSVTKRSMANEQADDHSFSQPEKTSTNSAILSESREG
jgi:parvulin-like peptidyl-prolyl isomerase